MENGIRTIQIGEMKKGLCRKFIHLKKGSEQKGSKSCDFNKQSKGTRPYIIMIIPYLKNSVFMPQFHCSNKLEVNKNDEKAI